MTAEEDLKKLIRRIEYRDPDFFPKPQTTITKPSVDEEKATAERRRRYVQNATFIAAGGYSGFPYTFDYQLS